MLAVRAICRSVGSKERVNPLAIGLLELLDVAAQLGDHFADLNERLGDESFEIERNDAGRAVGAARFVVQGLATFGKRKLTLDEGILWEECCFAIEENAALYRAASGAERERVRAAVANVLLSITGIRPSLPSVHAALISAEQRGAPPKQQRTSNRQLVKRETSKTTALVSLLKEVGLNPGTTANLKRGRARAKRRRAIAALEK
jgi:hypothetical protein